MKFKKFIGLMLGFQYDYVLFISNEDLFLNYADLNTHKYDEYDVRSICLKCNSIQIELFSKDFKCLDDSELETEIDFKQLCLEDCFDDFY